MHIERGDVGALVVKAQRPARQTSGKAKRELLADFTIGERDDVGGIDIDTGECGDLHVESGFFLDFTYGGLFDGFPYVVSAAWRGPELVVTPFYQQDAAVGSCANRDASVRIRSPG